MTTPRLPTTPTLPEVFESLEAWLQLIAERLEAHTALLRLLTGPAVDDATLAVVGGTLPGPLDTPIVLRVTTYPAGVIVRLPRTSPHLTVLNLGTLNARVRLYGTTLPSPDQPVDDTLPAPTDEVTIRAGGTLELAGGPFLTRGFLVVDEATLHVIAR